MPTILHRLDRWATVAPDDLMHRFKENGVWKPITVSVFRERLLDFVSYLESKKFGADDVLTLFSFNNSDWILADHAPGLVGSRSAGIYPNASSKDILYILNLTRSRILIVQDETYYKKISKNDPHFSLPDFVETVLVLRGPVSFSPKALSFEKAVQEGNRFRKSHHTEKQLSDYLALVDVHHGNMIVFTSGTTGEPKGAVLSMDNLAFATDIFMKEWKLKKFDHATMFSFLPLCHIAEKLQNIGVSTSLHAVVNFATSIEKLAEELKEVEPTILLSVPRIWEKMMEGASSQIAKESPKKKALIQWALALGRKKMEGYFGIGKFGIADYLQYRLANRLIISKIRKALGMGRVEMGASGAAPLSAQVSKWFWQLGIEILEDYGQSESSGVICITTLGKDCTGTVGLPPPGTEFKLMEDGEILSRGRHIFKGYYKNQMATDEVLSQGWLRTGDVGVRNPHGLIRLTGRKKEVLKTSGGKMVAPLPIEERLKENPLISQACVVGDGRKYCTALLTLKEEPLRGAEKKGDVVSDSGLLAKIKTWVDEVNKDLGSVEKIKNFRVLARDFTMDQGELTPTLKMKRKAVEKNFEHIIEEIYHSGGAAEAH